MSVRENIASNIKTVIDAISSPDVKLCTRQPFELEELSQQQYPAVIVQTSEENTYEFFNFPITSGLIPKGSLTPINFF